jgi:hypothetical protein
MRFIEFCGQSQDSLFNTIRSNGREQIMSIVQIQTLFGGLKSEKIKSHSYYFVDQTSRDSKGVIRKDDKGNTIINRVFVKDETSDEELIPTVIVDVVGKVWRVCISVAFLFEDTQCTMKEALKVLENKYSKKRTYITSFPVTEDVIDPVTKIPVTMTYHGINDTITLEHKDKTLVAQASISYSKTDMAILSNSTETRYDEKTTPKSEPSVYVIDDDLNQVIWTKYHIANGIEINDDSIIGLPENLEQLLWYLRQEDESYNDINKNAIKNYPGDLIAAEKLRIQELKGELSQQDQEDQQDQENQQKQQGTSLMDKMAGMGGKKRMQLSDMNPKQRENMMEHLSKRFRVALNGPTVNK